LQKQICERESNVHCIAHNLNLVQKDAICVQPVQIFFDNIQFYTFFSSSIKRWDLLLNVNLIQIKFEAIMIAEKCGINTSFLKKGTDNQKFF
jgi:hypothetical protein